MDRSKTGTKRSLLVEAGGVPVGLSVAGANKNDFKLVAETFQSVPVARPKPTQAHPQHVCLDKGYDYEEVRAILQAYGFVAHIRSRGEEAKAKKRKPGQKARRWVIERTHSWFNSLPEHPHALVQERAKLFGHALLRLRPHRLPCRTIFRIGS